MTDQERAEEALQEIEERKKTEEALRASEERYRSVVDHIGIGISLISPDMEIITLNDQMKKWFPDIDVSKKPLCYEAFNNPPRETICSYCPTVKTLQDGQVHESITETPAGNEIRHYRIIASPIKDRNGNVLSAIEMVDDFTEILKVQERLQESEAKYRNLIENINDVIFSVDTRRCITYISPAVERFLQYTVNEIIGVPFTRFVHPDDLPALLSRFEKTLDGNLQPYEFRVFAKDGAIFHVRTSSRPLWDDGRLVGLTGVMTDISEFKRAEEALRESERRLSDIIDFLPDATFAIDLNGKVIAWNRAIEEMTGVKAPDMLGKGNYEYALPFYGKRRQILIDLVFSSDEEIEKKYSFIKKEKDIILAETDVIMNGENRVLWGKARCLYDSKGNIVGAIQSIRDITDRKQAEEALRFSNLILSTQQETTHDGILVVDPEGKMISWNQRFIDMWDIPSHVLEAQSDELAIESVLGKLVNPKQFLAGVRRLYDDINATSDDELALADGRLFDRHSAPMIGGDGRHYGRVWYFRDITDRKRAEEILKKRERELEIKSRNLEELNAALKVLLRQREKDKDEIEEQVLANVKQLAMPYIERLKKSRLKDKEADYVNILESNLINIISPFSNKLSSKYLKLTPKEIQIANLIKEGKTSKDTAELLNISPGTVEFHRENIRRKLNLKNKKDNLRSYLLTLS
ncbi:MAG: PAS domain S-box protein [Deltaproteobacteria bacterium]|nr:PAS domain S-box protein [Deltaproteobacteria bacterium]